MAANLITQDIYNIPILYLLSPCNLFSMVLRTQKI